MAGTTMTDIQTHNGAPLRSLGGQKMSRRRMLKHAGAAGALSTIGRPLLAAGAATVGSSLATPAVSRAQEGITLRGIFLPATWGTITQEVFAKEYEEQTGVKVEIELIGRDAIHDKMGTLFVAQDPSYDIFNVDYNWVPEFARAGHLLPMDDVLAAPETEGDDFLPRALDVARWEDTLYGIPQTVHPHILWYRRDLFEEAGLEPPATMEEWRAIVEQFQGTEVEGQEIYGWAAQAARGFGNVHTWLTFLYSFGGDAFNFETMEPTLTTPEATEATQFWADMMKFTPPGINDYTYDEVTNDAAAGRIATCLQWSWGAFAVDDPATSKTVGLWEFVKVPAGTESVPHLAEWVISVSNYSQHQEEAIKFIQWLESPENDVRQALLGGGDPVRSSSYENPELTEAEVEGFPGLKRFRRYPETLEAMQTTKPRPLFPEEERWEQVVSVPLHAIQLGEMTVEEGLAKAQDDVNRMMMELGYY
jgi:multiple sugar transport system substrate-binding protein